MYRTFRKFENDNNSNRINTNRADYQTNQAQTTISSGGLSLQTVEGEPCQLYSKLNMIERILETYDDLSINAIQKKAKRTEDIDYSQIYKYLDRAIYLDNDVIYIETMNLPCPLLRYESTDIVTLYCYILDEIIQQLQEDVPDNIKDLSQDIRFLGQNFKDNYLTSDQSIFHKDTFLETTIILKETLDNVDKNTYYKDADYWCLYEAIETFLYGELSSGINDGNYWGIKGFSLIWEDMCQTYFFRNEQAKICYADTDISLKNHKNLSRIQPKEVNRVGNLSMSVPDGTTFCKRWIYSTESDVSDNDNQILSWHKLFVIEFDPNPRHLVCTDGYVLHPDYDYLDYGYDADHKLTKIMTRYLRPDLVLLDDNKVKIVDYKDVPLEFYLNPSKLSPKEHNKYKHDVIKQLTYEFAIQKTYSVSSSIFFVPYYYESPLAKEFLGEIEASLEIKGIRIFKANFFLIQEEYLQENL